MSDAEFVGNPGAQHIRRPEGTNLSFAAVLASVGGGVSLSRIHEALRRPRPPRGRLSAEDGSTRLMGVRTELRVARSLSHQTVFDIDPLERSDDPEEVLNLVDARLEAGLAVAVFHKSNSLADQHGYDWSLWSGYATHEDGKGAMTVMNPRHEHANYLGWHLITKTVSDSMNDLGFHAYSIDVAPVPERRPNLAVTAAIIAG